MSELITNCPSADLMKQYRCDFPILEQKIHGRPLVYLDNAATTQKPRQVVEKISQHYYSHNANIHRGVHTLSVKATEEFEKARQVLQKFINAQHPHEIIFTRGTTESINLVASSFGYSQLHRGDEIILTVMEHHSNIVPWQLMANAVGAIIKVVSVRENGELNIAQLSELITERTKMIAFNHVSNAIGTINPIKEIVAIAKQHNIVTLVDGAQAIQHMPVDVQALDCDFYVFSGHKMYGPTGVGVLYGKTLWLEQLPPYQGGGEMITEVTFEKTTFNRLPHKFEAGTPNITGVIGLAAAAEYLSHIGLENIQVYEADLLNYATSALGKIPELTIIGTSLEKAAVISFVIDNIHPHDIGTYLDHEGIAIRAGHHCAMPLMNHFNVPATVRASFSFYNTFDEIDLLVESLKKLIGFFTDV